MPDKKINCEIDSYGFNEYIYKHFWKNISTVDKNNLENCLKQYLEAEEIRIEILKVYNKYLLFDVNYFVEKKLFKYMPFLKFYNELSNEQKMVVTYEVFKNYLLEENLSLYVEICNKELLEKIINYEITMQNALLNKNDDYKMIVSTLDQKTTKNLAEREFWNTGLSSNDIEKIKECRNDIKNIIIDDEDEIKNNIENLNNIYFNFFKENQDFSNENSFLNNESKSFLDDAGKSHYEKLSNSIDQKDLKQMQRLIDQGIKFPSHELFIDKLVFIRDRNVIEFLLRNISNLLTENNLKFLRYKKFASNKPETTFEIALQQKDCEMIRILAMYGEKEAVEKFGDSIKDNCTWQEMLNESLLDAINDNDVDRVSAMIDYGVIVDDFEKFESLVLQSVNRNLFSMLIEKKDKFTNDILNIKLWSEFLQKYSMSQCDLSPLAFSIEQKYFEITKLIIDKNLNGLYFWRSDFVENYPKEYLMSDEELYYGAGEDEDERQQYEFEEEWRKLSSLDMTFLCEERFTIVDFTLYALIRVDYFHIELCELLMIYYPDEKEKLIHYINNNIFLKDIFDNYESSDISDLLEFYIKYRSPEEILEDCQFLYEQNGKTDYKKLDEFVILVSNYIKNVETKGRLIQLIEDYEWERTVIDQLEIMEAEEDKRREADEAQLAYIEHLNKIRLFVESNQRLELFLLDRVEYFNYYESITIKEFVEICNEQLPTGVSLEGNFFSKKEIDDWMNVNVIIPFLLSDFKK